MSALDVVCGINEALVSKMCGLEVMSSTSTYPVLIPVALNKCLACGNLKMEIKMLNMTEFGPSGKCLSLVGYICVLVSNVR